MTGPFSVSLEERVTLVDVGVPPNLGVRSERRGYLAEGGRIYDRLVDGELYHLLSFGSGDYFAKYGINLAWNNEHPIGPHTPALKDGDFMDLASGVSQKFGFFGVGRAQLLQLTSHPMSLKASAKLPVYALFHGYDPADPHNQEIFRKYKLNPADLTVYSPALSELRRTLYLAPVELYLDGNRRLQAELLY